MLKAKIAEICKNEGGYNVDISTGRDHHYEEHNFETFGRLIDFIARAFGVSDEERHPPMIVMEHSRRMGKSWDMAQRILGIDPASSEPDYDDLRDELGEVRRKLERAEKQNAELIAVNARLVKTDGELRESHRLADAHCAALMQMLVKNGINPANGKPLKPETKKPAPRKR